MFAVRNCNLYVCGVEVAVEFKRLASGEFAD